MQIIDKIFKKLSKIKFFFSRRINDFRKYPVPMSALITDENFNLNLKSINKEFHKIVDNIETLSKMNISSQFFYNNLTEMRELIGLIIENKDNILAKIPQKENIKLQISSILNWIRVSLDKLIYLTEPDNYNNETMHSLLKFCYESTWKLIIIFEEVLGISCSICSKRDRVVVYNNIFHKNNKFIEESKIIERDIVETIRQMDK